jgi:tetratricopeptide (TPR) repeat protein
VWQFIEEKRSADFLLNAREPDHTRLTEGVRQAEQALERYQVLHNKGWFEPPLVLSLSAGDREQAAEEVEDLMWTLARATSLQAMRSPEADRAELLARALEWNRRAETSGPARRMTKSLLAQRADLVEQLGQKEESRLLLREAERTPARTARDHFRLALDLVDRGESRKAVPLFQEASRQLEQSLKRNAQDPWSWYVLGNCHDRLHQDRAAHTCYTVCLALRPDWYEALFARALACCRERRWQHARDDFSRAIDVDPQRPEPWFERAMTEKALGHPKRAESDLAQAVYLGFPQTRIYFLRADVLDLLGDKEGARMLREEGLRRQPTDEYSWSERGVARLRQNEARGALDDFEQALKVNPRFLPAWQNKAHVLANLKKDAEALQAMDRAVQLHPDFVPARLGRGVLLARLGKRGAAHEEAQAALERDSSPATLYQAANVYALTARQDPQDRLAALPLLRRALAGGFGLDVIDQDSDMDPIRDHKDFRRIVQAARELATRPPSRKGAGKAEK